MFNASLRSLWKLQKRVMMFSDNFGLLADDCHCLQKSLGTLRGDMLWSGGSLLPDRIGQVLSSVLSRAVDVGVEGAWRVCEASPRSLFSSLSPPPSLPLSSTDQLESCKSLDAMWPRVRRRNTLKARAKVDELDLDEEEEILLWPHVEMPLRLLDQQLM